MTISMRRLIYCDCHSVTKFSLLNYVRFSWLPLVCGTSIKRASVNNSTLSDGTRCATFLRAVVPNYPTVSWSMEDNNLLLQLFWIDRSKIVGAVRRLFADVCLVSNAAACLHIQIRFIRMDNKYNLFTAQNGLWHFRFSTTHFIEPES